MGQEIVRAMLPYEWSEVFSVGIPELDIQHRRLIELLGELVKCTRSGDRDKFASIALQKVIQYAERHLQREELVLRVRGYPDYLEHKAEHDSYRKKAASLELHSGRRDLGIRITKFLTEWWRSHILTSDQQYARYFRCRPPAP